MSVTPAPAPTTNKRPDFLIAVATGVFIGGALYWLRSYFFGAAMPAEDVLERIATIAIGTTLVSAGVASLLRKTA